MPKRTRRMPGRPRTNLGCPAFQRIAGFKQGLNRKRCCQGAQAKTFYATSTRFFILGSKRNLKKVPSQSGRQESFRSYCSVIKSSDQLVAKTFTVCIKSLLLGPRSKPYKNPLGLQPGALHKASHPKRKGFPAPCWKLGWLQARSLEDSLQKLRGRPPRRGVGAFLGCLGLVCNKWCDPRAGTLSGCTV